MQGQRMGGIRESLAAGKSLVSEQTDVTHLCTLRLLVCHMWRMGHHVQGDVRLRSATLKLGTGGLVCGLGGWGWWVGGWVDDPLTQN